MATATPIKLTEVEAPMTGKIAVLWDPAKDRTFKLATTIGNAKPIRTFSYTVITEYRKQINQGDTPIFDFLDLRFVGINWVDVQLWEKAKAQSKERDGIIQKLMGDGINGAIREFKPKVRELTGTLADYEDDDAIDMINEIYDPEFLGAVKREHNLGSTKLVAHVQERIESIKSGEIL